MSRMRDMFEFPLRRWGLPALLLAALGLAAPLAADDDEPETSWLVQPIAAIDGYFPTPWACNGAAPAPQSVLQFHRNWHCSNPDNSGANWGNRFFGFHKQFLLGFDRYRAANGFPYTQTWVAAPNAPIPPRHGGRPVNAPCATCLALPNAYRLPAAGGTLNTFATVTAIGDAIVTWHNTNHGRIAQAGGTGSCSGGAADMACPSFSPTDPIFYRYHHIFDDVQEAWMTIQPADVMIVFDRSGSMGLPAAGGGTRLEAARTAANMFADLLDDTGSSRVGLVSFSTAATSPSELAPTLPGPAPAAMSAALTPIVASGATSIGAGLQQAMVSLGAASRKAILLLTDGQENTAPNIASVVAGLGDTHLCAVGFGAPGSLDGPKLRDLAERQGGIYVSGPGALELRKFFVDCFADIFDSFVGSDPVEILDANAAASAFSSQTVMGDAKLAFVLSWSQPAAPGALRLEVTSPSGRRVVAGDPGLQSSFGDTWQIVRFPLPLAGEQDGVWTAQAVRGVRSFANGFTGNAFVDPVAGAELVRRQLRQLCPSGCPEVLYYEDEMEMTETSSFEEHNSVYAAALYGEVPLGTVRNVTRVRDPQEFAERLRKGGFDLLVYASKIAGERQPYDELLERLLCAPDAPAAIVSDNRQFDDVARLWECVGARPTGELDWTEVLDPDGLFGGSQKLMRPEHVHGPFSFGLAPLGDRGAAAAGNPLGSSAIVSASAAPLRQELFIEVLTDAAARVLPFAWRSHYYTGEELHPTFHIPEAYWPEAGFDSVKAVVRVTRPLRGLGALAAEVGAQERDVIGGDVIDPRTAALLRLDPDQTGEAVGSEVLEFELFDDGTNGDGTANDRYWEAALPADIAKVDGEYEFHALFELCRGDQCVTREARHKTVVEVKLDPRATGLESRPLQGQGRNLTEIVFTPQDGAGNPMGPGLAGRLLIGTQGDAKLESLGDADGRGAYRLVASWSEAGGPAGVSIGQFGRPADTIQVPLRP